jgi:hypothetical protein
MPENLLARPAAREYGLCGFGVIDLPKLRLGCFDYAQELLVQGFHITQPSCRTLII